MNPEERADRERVCVQMQEKEEMSNRLIRLRECIALTSLSESTIRRLEASGSFPARVQLAKNSVAWRLNEVIDYIETRVAVPPKGATTEK